MDLTDEQWTVVAPLLPHPRRRADGRGRPWRDPRDVLNGILWVLRTGAPWHDLPTRYPSYQTCHRRFQHWVESGTLTRVLRALARDLETRGGLDLSECFIDGTFAGAKGGAPAFGPTRRGKGTKIMAVADRAGLPIAISLASASPHEVTLVEATLAARLTRGRPHRLIGDAAYDSDPLDARLADQDIIMIAPHRRGRLVPTQDGRAMRRYRRRWKIERFFAWLQQFRRLVTRYERSAANFLGLVELGCICILLRHL
ncbi:MAG: IS5 family transposase [Anaerolineales bacterium]